MVHHYFYGYKQMAWLTARLDPLRTHFHTDKSPNIVAKAEYLTQFFKVLGGSGDINR